METIRSNSDDEIQTENLFDLPANRDGRDEMNLSEYPIALLSDRAPQDIKTLVYKDKDETLTITGSDLLGLPTSMDIDVIIGILYLTKKKNDFTDRTINFTRYELLQVLKWPGRGHYYDRITESLNRWVGTTLIYKKSWWDNDRRVKRNASFHIIDAVNIVERSEWKSGQQQLPLSMIRWGEDFFRSCQANNLKKLDLEIYFSLKSSISKQLYRFLDKRFYRRPLWTFDLRTLACEHVGLSRVYPAWKLKQKLSPAIEELTEVGLIRRAKPQERYRRAARGEWIITLAKAGTRHVRVPRPEDDESQNPLERELTSRGVIPSTAADLVERYPEEEIKARVEQFDWLKAHDPKKVAKGPGGFLADSLRKGYGIPTGFMSKADMAKREEANQGKRRREAEHDQHKHEARVQERKNKAQVDAYLKGLGPEALATLDEQALEQADPSTRVGYEQTTHAALKRVQLRVIRESYVRRVLKLPEPVSD